jgi:hypothetical protein
MLVKSLPPPMAGSSGAFTCGAGGIDGNPGPIDGARGTLAPGTCGAPPGTPGNQLADGPGTGGLADPGTDGLPIAGPDPNAGGGCDNPGGGSTGGPLSIEGRTGGLNEGAAGGAGPRAGLGVGLIGADALPDGWPSPKICVNPPVLSDRPGSEVGMPMPEDAGAGGIGIGAPGVCFGSGIDGLGSATTGSISGLKPAPTLVDFRRRAP